MAESAQAAAERFGVAIQISYAENDPILQSQQLLKIVQTASERPDAILFHPFGSTALPQVARAAVTAGIGVGVLNWQADYVTELRHGATAPVFICSSNQRGIGRIQGEQAAALLPGGGAVLHIQGPTVSHAAKERASSMNEHKPANIHTKVIKAAAWTEEAGYKAVQSWLRLSTSRTEVVDAVMAQNDLLAMGARKAFGEIQSQMDKARWLSLPFTGINGLPKTGQVWVRKGLLAATVIDPPDAGLAVEAMAKAIRGRSQPPECILTVPRSYPSIEEIKNRQRHPNIPIAPAASG